MRLPRSALAAVVAVAVLGGVGVAVFGVPGSSPDHGTPPTTAGPPTTALGALPPDWVKTENARPGTTDWHLTKASKNGEIEGFADKISVSRGDAVRLFVSTRSPTYSVTLFRMGFYGGAQGRLVWASMPQSGALQSPPTVTPGTNMVETSWTPSMAVTTDERWPPGDYLFKLTASGGFDSYIPLTVRDDGSQSGLLVQNSVTTWQAYNLWGGFDLYEGRTARGSSFANRSRVVSFDRPYRIGDGSGDFLGNELPLVSLVESWGVDVSYATDVDLHEHPERVLQHHALVSLGHDEYWSSAMRSGAENARDHGVNLAFLGANAVFRHIRLEPSPLGIDRHVVDYKNAKEDPLNGINNAEVTVDWREPPVSRPENTLLGELYQCNPVKADLVVTDPSAWIYAGTGLTAGARLAGLVGSEYDEYVRSLPGPAGVEVMAHSPVTCHGNADHSDLTYYVAASGAGVLDTGTNLWVPKLSDPSLPILPTITRTILSAFAAGPAGRTHPGAPGTTADGAPPSSVSPTPSSTAATSPPTTTPNTTAVR